MGRPLYPKTRAGRTFILNPFSPDPADADFQNMYLGVLKDEARLKERAAELERLATPRLPTTYNAPLNTPSAPVQQPAAVVDPDCVTCVASPPPDLLEAQTKEQRAVERRERLAEYEAQKKLGHRLEKEQGVSDQ